MSRTVDKGVSCEVEPEACAMSAACVVAGRVDCDLAVSGGTMVVDLDNDRGSSLSDDMRDKGYGFCEGRQSL